MIQVIEILSQLIEVEWCIYALCQEWKNVVKWNGPQCPLSPKRLLNLITHSLVKCRYKFYLFQAIQHCTLEMFIHLVTENNRDCCGNVSSECCIHYMVCLWSLVLAGCNRHGGLQMMVAKLGGQLTHPPLDKMDAILQTIFSDAFFWMKSFVFWLKFHWSLFLIVQLTITQHWFR